MLYFFLPETKRVGPGCSWTSVRNRNKVCIRHHRMNSWSSSAPGVPSRSMMRQLGVIQTSIPYKCHNDVPWRWPCTGIDRPVGCNVRRCCDERLCPSDDNRNADTWGNRKILAGCNCRIAFRRILDDMNKRQSIGHTDWNAILVRDNCMSNFERKNEIKSINFIFLIQLVIYFAAFDWMMIPSSSDASLTLRTFRSGWTDTTARVRITNVSRFITRFTFFEKKKNQIKWQTKSI